MVRRATDRKPSEEIRDFSGFLGTVERLSRGHVTSNLRRVEADVERILQNPFLNIECWRNWDHAGIRDRQKRRASSCNTYDKAHPLERVFCQLYTLRNQILHGAATDGGQRNRESLLHAIPVLDVAVRVLIELVELHDSKMPKLEPLPYPPSIGDGGSFNGPRLTTRTAHGTS